jgi:hypothetical protein
MKEILLSIMMVAGLVACVTAFILLLAYKLGIIEYLQVHGDKVISQMAQCNFCMSFWLSVLQMIVIVAVTDESSLIAIPLVSTPIARILVA